MLRRPLASIVGLLAASVLVLFVACAAHNGGAFVYCVDDAYIHLALAKNLVAHGVYGVRPDEFAAASSSIAWPWMLALCMEAAGPLVELAPLVLGAVAAALLAVLVARILRESSPSLGPRRLFVLTFLVLFLAPIVPVVFVGMEHVPHALATLALAYAGAREATSSAEQAGGARFRALARLFALAAVAAALRYETWFLLGPLVALLAARRRFTASLALFAGGAIPVLAYALFAHAHDAPWLPMSVILKGAHASPQELPGLAYRHLLENPHVLVVLAALSLAWSLRRAAHSALGDATQVLLALAFVTLVAHVTLAQLGWFFRYEAYALILALTAIAAAIAPVEPEVLRSTARMACLPLAVVTLPLTLRALGAHRAVPLASGNIADQQRTMARFLDEAYRGRAVAVNDVGAVGYFADVRVVDLMGLGSTRVAAMKDFRIDHGLDRDALVTLASTEKFPVAIVYDDWFRGAIPASWTAVARWTIVDNRVCAKDTVTLYAVSAGDTQELREALSRFASEIPKRVAVETLPP